MQQPNPILSAAWLRTCLSDTGDIGIVFSESYEKSSKGWFDGVSIAGEDYVNDALPNLPRDRI